MTNPAPNEWCGAFVSHMKIPQLAAAGVYYSVKGDGHPGVVAVRLVEELVDRCVLDVGLPEREDVPVQMDGFYQYFLSDDVDRSAIALGCWTTGVVQDHLEVGFSVL